MDNLAFELRSALAHYLAGDLPIREFHDLAMALTWNAENQTDPMTAAAARDIELLLSEHNHGDWTESELRERLMPLATQSALQH